MLYYARKLRRFVPAEREFQIKRVVNKVLPANSPQIPALMHCCSWKTGSQWVKMVLSDPRFYMATGLTPQHIFNSWAVREDPQLITVKNNQVVTGGFIDYETYLNIDKPEGTRTFFVAREPKKLLVSWYISTRYSHPSREVIDRQRKEMEGMNDEEGMLYTVDIFDQIYDLVTGWRKAKDVDGSIQIVRYEDIVGENQLEVWCELLESLGLTNIKKRQISNILKFYHIKRLKPSKAPSKGGVNSEKYGSAGSRNDTQYLTDKVLSELYSKYPNLEADFGY